MPKHLLQTIDTWVFDLDNTLYPPHMRLFDQIETRMTAWVMTSLGVSEAEADRLRSTYWRAHGTTLAGLMRVHNVDPHGYLHDVHDIDFTVLDPDPQLRAAIERLPGRKIIYTNGTAPYARNVIEHRGLSDLFDAIYGVEHADFHPKPDHAAFEQVFGADGFDRSRALMFEDEPRNLQVPHAMGLATVHVAPAADPRAYIDHHTDDLRGFLTQIVG